MESDWLEPLKCSSSLCSSSGVHIAKWHGRLREFVVSIRRRLKLHDIFLIAMDPAWDRQLFASYGVTLGTA